MKKVKSKKMPSVMLTLDFGGSGLKCIYQKIDGEAKVLFMEAEVIAAEANSLKEKTEKQLGSAEPENMAWVGIDDDYRAIGYFASCQYQAIPLLKPKKHSLAVYRTLAAIWVVQQRLKLPQRLRIALAVLLPPGEIEDGPILLQNLKKALASFSTPTGKLNVGLSDFDCYSEGSGVYLMHCYHSGEIIKQKILALIMVGYRNASILLSMKGMVTEAKSIDLGLSKYVESILKKTSGLKPAQILKSIAKAPAKPSQRDFLHLTEVHLNLGQRLEEAAKILDAVVSCKKGYLTAIQAWLSEVLPSELDEVVFCGGTVDYFQPELDSLFPATPVKWHGGFNYPEELNEEWLGNRLADAYGLAKVFRQKIVNKYQSQEKVMA